MGRPFAVATLVFFLRGKISELPPSTVLTFRTCRFVSRDATMPVNAWCAGPGVMILSVIGTLVRCCCPAAGLAAMSALTRIAAHPAKEGAEWPEMAPTEARRDQGRLLKGLASPWKEFTSAARRRARSVYSLPGSRPESSSPLFLFSL